MRGMVCHREILGARSASKGNSRGSLARAAGSPEALSFSPSAGSRLGSTRCDMPPRNVVCVIVAFWLTATGYLAYREWWPWMRADSPPPFTVELADEATPQNAHWS